MTEQRGFSDEPYELLQFTRKWNISKDLARRILELHGPSRVNCDAAAVKLKTAQKTRRGGYP